MPELRRRRMADEVYVALRQLVTDGECEAGDRLLVTELADRFGVSPTPVREALARLVDDGLVQHGERQGYVVSKLLDRGAVEELYQVRMRLEPWAAGLAARAWDGDDLSRLVEIQGSVPARHSGEPYASYATLSQLDLAFHAEILRLSRVDLLGSLMRRLIPRMRQFHAYRQSGALDQAWKEHKAIAEAIAARRPDDAEQAAMHHLEQALERIRAEIAPWSSC